MATTYRSRQYRRTHRWTLLREHLVDVVIGFAWGAVGVVVLYLLTAWLMFR